MTKTKAKTTENSQQYPIMKLKPFGLHYDISEQPVSKLFN